MRLSCGEKVVGNNFCVANVLGTKRTTFAVCFVPEACLITPSDVPE